MTNEEAKHVAVGDRLYNCSRYADGTRFNISIVTVREVRIHDHVKGRQKPVELMCVAENFVSDRFKDSETAARLNHEAWSRTATEAVKFTLSMFGEISLSVDPGNLSETIYDLVAFHRCLKEAVKIDDEKIQRIELKNEKGGDNG